MSGSNEVSRDQSNNYHHNIERPLYDESDFFVPKNTKVRKIDLNCFPVSSENVKDFAFTTVKNTKKVLITIKILSKKTYKYIKKRINKDYYGYEEIYDLEIDENGHTYLAESSIRP